MLVVKIELWSGITHQRKEIGRMYIANTGGTDSLGEYDVKVCRKSDNFEYKGWDQIKSTREGHVNRYPRLTANVWQLVARALLSAFPEEVKAKR